MRHVRLVIVSLFLQAAVLPLSAGIWKTGDLPFVAIADVAAHPTVRGLVFASTAAGVFRSSDSGTHWQRVTDMPFNHFGFIPPHPLAFNPFNDGEVCALGDSFGACTTDLGTTWAPFPQPGMTFLLFDPRVADRMFMGTPYGQDWLFVSNDHGRSWTKRGFTEGHPWFHSTAAIDVSSGAMFETASPHGGCIPSCGIFRSLDGRSTWLEVAPEQVAWTLATDQARTTVLYAMNLDLGHFVVRASSDDGTTWNTRGTLPIVNGSVGVLSSDPRSVSILYAGADGGMLFRSVDGGRSWSRIDHGELPASDRITQITVGIDGSVYAATDHQVFALTGIRRRGAIHK